MNATKSQTWKVGDISITSVFEVDASSIIQDIIPEASRSNLSQIPWLQPHFVDGDGKIKAQVQSFVIQSGNHKVIVDTGVGNGRSRPGLLAWDHLETDFLSDLKQVSGDPASFDFVLCTHLHFDHVGWNTWQEDAQWVPTFKNARYLIAGPEFNYWAARPSGELQDDFNAFTDSIEPIQAAGLLDLVPSDHQVIAGISLIPTPGHTPGHVGILIESQGQSAVITGDLFHHPCQVAHPEWMSSDTDETLALATRKQFLERFTDTETLVLGSHFAFPVAGRLKSFEDSTRFIS